MYIFNHILKVSDKLLLLHAVEIIVVFQDTISLQLFFFFLAFSEFHCMFIKESVGIRFLIIIIMIIIIMMMIMIIIIIIIIIL